MRKIIIIIIICAVAIAGLFFIGFGFDKMFVSKPTPPSTLGVEYGEHIYQHKGVCPDCGTVLIKGIYGYSYPHSCWYCPNCE